MPQSNTTGQRMTPQGSDTKHRQQQYDDNVEQLAVCSSAKLLQILERILSTVPQKIPNIKAHTQRGQQHTMNTEY